MRRREFLSLFAGVAAAWPLTARAQQPPTPVVGFIRPSRAEEAGHLVAAVRLRESGYSKDKYEMEARWANGRTELLPELAAELVVLKVAAIVASVDARARSKGSYDKHSDNFRDRG
jgi:putative ABC transport system substrate-binding protein